MRATDPRTLRADMHVHSYHSGYSSQLSFLRARDCYSEPEAVYAAAKSRGMDIVTITDHDSIDGCLEFLERHPDADDFFISEEIECQFPGIALKVHIGAYDIDERIHRDIQTLRGSVFEAASYLRAEGVLYALNHPFFFYRGQVPLADYLGALLPLFPAYEVRNGTMLPAHNLLADALVCERAGAALPAMRIGGSDSHTLKGIGTTYTEVPGASKEDFLQNLRAGLGSVGGRHGSVLREAREIYGVVARYWLSLLGAGRQDLNWRRRTLGLAFSAVSMPCEFTPLLVAAMDKRAEARRVAEYRRDWESRVAPDGDRTGHSLAIPNRVAEPQ
jgi:predicted metal-dependent phosphoesterase TrpH